MVDTYRYFGRLGLGTVFGAKKLKALLIAGNEEIKYELKKKFGFKFEKLTLPKRFFETVSTTGKLEEERFEGQSNCIEEKESCKVKNLKFKLLNH